MRILFLILYGGLALEAQVSVLTANYGVERTNANLQETILSPKNVNSGQFGKIGVLPVDGQIYAQPLYAGGLSIPGKGTRDVVFVATMHDSVYAFDADSLSPTPLWQVSLGTSVPATFLNMKDVQPEIGILSTPVIDPQLGVLYVIAETFENGTCVFRLHALDLTSGQERMNGPVVVSAAVSGSGDGSQDNTIVFDPTLQLQRPGLLLANGMIYAAFGSHQDYGTYHGWLIAYTASNLPQMTGVFVTTPNASGGAIWQSGRGLAADETGSLYLVTGNGDYDGQPDFGESFLKFSGSTLSVLDWFTPANWQTLTDGDYDLSAGPALVPGTHRIIGGNKAGTLYLVNGDSMGQLGADTAGNVQSLPAIQWGGIFNFAVWNRADATYVYVQEQAGVLKGYRIVNGSFETAPFSQSIARADIPRIGIAVSAAGGQDGTGIVWETTGDHTIASVPGTLHAFDASDLTNQLWTSEDNPGRDRLGGFVKFVSPTVANGRVYTPTLSNQLVVYGLLPAGGVGTAAPAVTSVANGASSVQGAISPAEVVMITGSGFGPTDQASAQVNGAGLVATELAATQVLFDGIPAPILWVGPNQVSAITPLALLPGTTQVQVQYQGQASAPVAVPVAAASPAVFSQDGSGTGQGLIVNENGTLNSSDNPASAGSVVVFYATGTGPISPSLVDGQLAGDTPSQPALPVSVQINGQSAEVLYAGTAPGLVAGIIQVNARIPDGASGAVPVVVRVGGSVSQAGITAAVQ
ncbi:MAG TPA: IPT/TIG domain-containing protein [Bryobacteraceae bacterium]|nr:IPT/TIG domain-containing protein [Bryobacteraceae bacterium]